MNNKYLSLITLQLASRTSPSLCHNSCSHVFNEVFRYGLFSQMLEKTYCIMDMGDILSRTEQSNRWY